MQPIKRVGQGCLGNCFNWRYRVWLSLMPDQCRRRMHGSLALEGAGFASIRLSVKQT